MFNSKSLTGLAAIALAALPTLAHAYAWSSSAQYATWSNSGYTVYVDAWRQVGVKVYANNGYNFSCTANYSGSGTVKAYPHNGKGKNQSVSSYSGNTASINVGGGSGSYDYAFDNWQPQETMIWNKWASTYPIGSLKKSNASIGGWTWNVYNGGSNVTSLLASSQFTYSTSVPIGQCMAYVQSNYGGSTLTSIQYGVELLTGNSTWNVYNATYP